ncbi:MAG TPA: PEP/pyruvate-binding domain-containing protein, partial [Parafilimonas sp.]|nr:PEP/pyruvate-binding domain-containing protein [Parafilimonas sp.]
METTFKEVSEKRFKETAKTINKYVFSFHEGDGKNKQLLGGKGANLCEMTQIGLNVPPGFVISTEACMSYLANNKQLPEGVMEQALEQMKKVEEATGKFFGNAGDPLL